MFSTPFSVTVINGLINSFRIETSELDDYALTGVMEMMAYILAVTPFLLLNIIINLKI